MRVETIHETITVHRALWPWPLRFSPAGDRTHFVGDLDVRVAEVLVTLLPDQFTIVRRPGAPEPARLPAPPVREIPSGFFVRVRSRFPEAPLAEPIEFRPEGDGRHFVAHVSSQTAKDLIALGPHWGFEILGSTSQPRP